MKSEKARITELMRASLLVTAAAPPQVTKTPFEKKGTFFVEVSIQSSGKAQIAHTGNMQ